MALIRWEPVGELNTIQNEMNRLFNTFFDQPAALREFHRVLSSGGLVAVSTLSARQPLLQGPSTSRWKPAHHPSSAAMRPRTPHRTRVSPKPRSQQRSGCGSAARTATAIGSRCGRTSGTAGPRKDLISLVR